ncbi:MAG TPA: hypothetical protein VKB51_11215 [bacterium]|nr:hypothetical protein [bacterium]
MSSKSPPIAQSKAERTDAGTDVVLRDESDEIIDNLKQQLQALQAQLNSYKRATPPGGSGGTIRPEPDERQTLDLGLTPHIASRLQIPAEELTQRLERIIEQVTDPSLRAELEACRDTAFFLSDTFQRIEQQHQALTDSLTADALVMDAGTFRERLEGSLRDRSLAMRVEAVSPLPAQLRLSPQSAITVLTTLAELTEDLFGRAQQITVACPRMDDAAEGADTFLQLQITGDAPWAEVAEGEAVSAVAIRSGARSRAVVDLLYVEKIIEMRGGSLDFLRRAQGVCGFTVHIPITLLKKVAPTSGAVQA